MKKYFWKFFMNKIDTAEEAAQIGKRVREKNLDYLIFNLHDGNYAFKILRDKKEVFEFFCSKQISFHFLDEAVNF